MQMQMRLLLNACPRPEGHPVHARGVRIIHHNKPELNGFAVLLRHIDLVCANSGGICLSGTRRVLDFVQTALEPVLGSCCVSFHRTADEGGNPITVCRMFPMILCGCESVAGRINHQPNAEYVLTLTCLNF